MTATILEFPRQPVCTRCEQPGETLPCVDCGVEVCGDCLPPHVEMHSEEESGLDWNV